MISHSKTITTLATDYTQKINNETSLDGLQSLARVESTKEIKIGQYFYGKKKEKKREVDQRSHGDAQKKKNYRSGELFGGTEAIGGILFFKYLFKLPRNR